MKIKKGDKVLIIKGKDKGKKSKVLRGFPESGQILVEGVNLKKVHKRPKREGEKGQVVEIPASFPASKAKVLCPSCNNPTAIKYKVEGERKTRVCKKCGAEI